MAGEAGGKGIWGKEKEKRDGGDKKVLLPVRLFYEKREKDGRRGGQEEQRRKGKWYSYRICWGSAGLLPQCRNEAVKEYMAAGMFERNVIGGSIACYIQTEDSSTACMHVKRHRHRKVYATEPGR